MKTGIELIAAERERQITAEGWSAAHDDEHTQAELERAALCYLDVAASQAIVGGKGQTYGPPDEWPWELEWWKPSDDPQRNRAKAGALLVAAMDRHSRQNGAGEQVEDTQQAVANARLIAAAPDMVSALIKMHEAGKEGGVHEDDWYMCLLSETITKALGPDWQNAKCAGDPAS